MGSFWSSGNSEEHKKEETNDESSNPSEFSENTTSIIVPSAQEIRNWKKTIRKLISEIEKETLNLERAINKTRKIVIENLKKKQLESAKIVGKEYLKAKKKITHFQHLKAECTSLSYTIDRNISLLKTTGKFEKNAEIVKLLTDIIQVDKFRENAVSLSSEMFKSGLIDEQIEDTFDTALEKDADDQEVNSFLNQVIDELSTPKTSKRKLDDEIQEPNLLHQSNDAPLKESEERSPKKQKLSLIS